MTEKLYFIIIKIVSNKYKYYKKKAKLQNVCA